QIEDLIKAKGFADCVVYISDDGVNITVPAPQEGLAASSVAKITDVVVSQTDYKAVDLRINEVK
ncbi:MAG: SpoIIIAH-like family protein, partial [Clostridiales bacterium]|nr:SpoIIIAH-like family protein [Clostridiales bacterium]